MATILQASPNRQIVADSVAISRRQPAPSTEAATTPAQLAATLLQRHRATVRHLLVEASTAALPLAVVAVSTAVVAAVADRTAAVVVTANLPHEVNPLG